MDKPDPKSYSKWEDSVEDQGIGPDFSVPDFKHFDDADDDDVFRSDVDAEPMNVKEKAQLHFPAPPPPPLHCCLQWSVNQRCIDCAWKTQRGGRPPHPPPPITPTSPLVTLQSLGTTRDSGYEPSPTSAFSFTFTSDDEEAEAEEGSTDTLAVESPLRAAGVTPPINIPLAKAGGARSKVRPAPTVMHGDTPPALETPKDLGPERGNSPMASAPVTPAWGRGRSKSVPELYASERMLQRTPVVVGQGPLRQAAPGLPLHGRNFSLPATTPDGQPIFASSPPTPAIRSSREGLIDLTEEVPEGSSGHHRRVLVLALPDLLVDLTSLTRDSSSSSSTTSTPSSSSSTTSKDTNPSSPPTGASSSSRLSAWPRSSPAGVLSSDASSEGGDVFRRRQRPRALSCDVTLEVEFGKELRRIADNFTPACANEHVPGMWRKLRNSIGRRFSLGMCTPLEETPDASDDRVSHSLPTSPYHPVENADEIEYFL